MSRLILVVDDDADIRRVVSFALRREGFETLEARNGVEAVALWRERAPDLVILDILMPEVDGLEVCRRVRAATPTSESGPGTPIIFLSSKDDEIDRVVGLEVGGDDYVTKPFSPRELVARVKAVLRRQRSVAPGEHRTHSGPVLEHGELVLDPTSHKVHFGADEIALTVTEFALLRTLMAHPNKVYSRSELVDRVHSESIVVSLRTVDSHVTRIRGKFEAVGFDPIETVRGVGYTCRAPRR